MQTETGERLLKMLLAPLGRPTMADVEHYLAPIYQLPPIVWVAVAAPSASIYGVPAVTSDNVSDAHLTTRR